MTLATPASATTEELISFTVGDPHPLVVYGVLHAPTEDGGRKHEWGNGRVREWGNSSGEVSHSPIPPFSHSPDIQAPASLRPTPNAAVLLLPGWSGTRVGPHGILVAMARELAAAGFWAMRFDFRGRGDSGGAQREAHIGTMVEDTRCAAELLRQRTGVQKVFILGICAGAQVALAAAASLPDLAGLALWSPPPFHPDPPAAHPPIHPHTHTPTHPHTRRLTALLRQYAAKLFDPRTWEKLRRGQLQPRTILRILLGREVRPTASSGEIILQDTGWAGPKPDERRYELALPALEIPAFFVFGGNDPEREGATAYYRQLRAAQEVQTCFHVVEGSNHAFYSLEWKREVIAVTLDWIRSQCAGSST